MMTGLFQSQMNGLPQPPEIRSGVDATDSLQWHGFLVMRALSSRVMSRRCIFWHLLRLSAPGKEASYELMAYETTAYDFCGSRDKVV